MRHGDRQRVIRSSAQAPLWVACAVAVLILSTPDAWANDPAHAIADKFAAEAERARQRDGQPPALAPATVDAERNAALKAAEAKRAADAKKAAEQRKKAAAKKLAEAEQQRKADQADQAAMIEQVRRELEELKAEEARAAEADRLAAEQSRQAEAERMQALAEAEAAARRVAEVEAALEEEAKRRVLAERAAREARDREAEASRIAEAEAERRRLAEQAAAAAAKQAELAAAEAKELENARMAEEQQRLAEQAAKAAEQSAALRDEESQRLAERLARQRAIRQPPPDTRPLDPEPTRDAKPVDVARQQPVPAPIEAAPAKPAALAARDPAGDSDTGKAGPRRATVLLSIRPGERGIRRFEKSADPVLCAGAICYISLGAGQDAKAVSRNAALGTANTLGGRAGACNRSLTCVFRNIDLGDGSARLQPIDLKIMRHDRRSESEAAADTTCTVIDGKLDCRTPVVASDYRLWIVPEDIARKAGPDELATAVVARLQASD